MDRRWIDTCGCAYIKTHVMNIECFECVCVGCSELKVTCYDSRPRGKKPFSGCLNGPVKFMRTDTAPLEEYMQMEGTSRYSSGQQMRIPEVRVVQCNPM